MKLISDFDGVWTDPLGEAEAVTVATRQRFTSLTGATSELVLRALDAASAAMDREPERYGWTIDGAISAFSDEDPFVRNNALAHFLEQLTEADARIAEPELRAFLLGLRAAAIASHGSPGALANEIFNEATLRYRIAEQPAPSPVVAAAMAGFLAAGHEVVIVSNSSTDKIADFLGRSPLAFTRGGPSAQEPGKIRIRGGALKFQIGGAPHETIVLAGRTVRCDRPRYREIIEEEQADAVIGDVVSLDHALPLRLARSGGPRLRPFLVARSYTPNWARTVAADLGLPVLAGLEEFPARWRALS